LPRKEKFREYEYETKTTTIRIPDLKDLDKEKQLRKEIDNFVLERLFKKQNLKANTILNHNNEKLEKLRFAFIQLDLLFENLTKLGVTPKNLKKSLENYDIELHKEVKEMIKL